MPISTSYFLVLVLPPPQNNCLCLVWAPWRILIKDTEMNRNDLPIRLLPSSEEYKHQKQPTHSPVRTDQFNELTNNGAQSLRLTAPSVFKKRSDGPDTSDQSHTWTEADSARRSTDHFLTGASQWTCLPVITAADHLLIGASQWNQRSSTWSFMLTAKL